MVSTLLRVSGVLIVVSLLAWCGPPGEQCPGNVCDVEECPDGEPETFYIDADGDGIGSDQTVMGCAEGEGRAADSGDCDDSDDGVFPGARELCNEVDDDCDGETDEDCADPVDEDGDGFCAALPSGRDAPDGCDPSGEDCDDGDAEVYPGAVEDRCGPRDLDCDGSPPVPALTWELLSHPGPEIEDVRFAPAGDRAVVAFVDNQGHSDTAHVLFVNASGAPQTEVRDLTEPDEYARSIDLVPTDDGFLAVVSIRDVEADDWRLVAVELNDQLDQVGERWVVAHSYVSTVELLDATGGPWIRVWRPDDDVSTLVHVETGDSFPVPQRQERAPGEVIYAGSLDAFAFRWEWVDEEDDRYEQIVTVDRDGMQRGDSGAVEAWLRRSDRALVDNGAQLLMLARLAGNDNPDQLQTGVVDPATLVPDAWNDHDTVRCCNFLHTVDRATQTVAVFAPDDGGGDDFVLIDADRDERRADLDLDEMDLAEVSQARGLGRAGSSWGLPVSRTNAPLAWLEVFRGDEQPGTVRDILAEEVVPTPLNPEWADVRRDDDGAYHFVQVDEELEEVQWVEQSPDGELNLRRAFEPPESECNYLRWSGADILCHGAQNSTQDCDTREFWGYRLDSDTGVWTQAYRFTTDMGETDSGGCSFTDVVQRLTLPDGRRTVLLRRRIPTGEFYHEFALRDLDTGEETVVATSSPESGRVEEALIRPHGETLGMLTFHRRVEGETASDWVELNMLDANTLQELWTTPVGFADRAAMIVDGDRFVVVYGEDTTSIASIAADASGAVSKHVVSERLSRPTLRRFDDVRGLWRARNGRVGLAGLDDLDLLFDVDAGRFFDHQDVARVLTHDEGTDLFLRGDDGSFSFFFGGVGERSFRISASCR